MLNPDDLKQRLLDVQEESENIIKAAMAEDREELTEEENDKLEGLDVEYKSIEKQIKILSEWKIAMLN